MYSTQFDYLNSEESETSMENDIGEKYTLLQNNHRRLLGVATILTEALENTVKGCQFNLENTLNKCMEIYPELFVLRQRKLYSKLTNAQKIYTTPASDFTDIEILESIDVLSKNENLKYSKQESNRIVREKIKPPKSARFYEENRTNNSYNNQKLFTNKMDTAPLASNKRNSITSQSSEINYSKISEMQENQMLNESNYQTNAEENEYVVKHPESDTEQFSGEVHNRRTSIESTTFAFNTEVNKENFGSNRTVPYEIIVNNTVPKSTMNNLCNEGDLLIKIKPETMDSSFIGQIHTISTVETQSNQNFLSTPRKTIISSPLETCIIITNHANTSIQKMNDTASTENKSAGTSHNNNSEENKMNIIDTNEEFIEQEKQSNIITDKLQKLSTGLKVHADVMEVPLSHAAFNLQNEVYKNEKLNEINEHIKKQEFQILSYRSNSERQHYENLKQSLMASSVNDCASIIQSLRLKLIHTLAKERADLVSSYVQYDILNLNKDITILDHLLPKEIVNGWDLILQQMVLKFLNTLCSIWKGRDYLSNNVKVITCLITYFFEKHKTRIPRDSLSQDMLIATFHKLSTRPNQQAVLLNTGLLEKIFHNISEGYGSMSTYKVKHSLGILINLCVNSNGRNLLEPVCSEMLQFLLSLLKRKDKKVMPYVARLIYVLMANEVFHKKAKEINLHKSLEESIDPSNKRLKLQLNILTSVIDHSNPHQYLNGTEENFLANIEAEMDELEEEVELGEPFLHNNSSVKNTIEESPIKVRHLPNKEIKQTSIPVQRNSVKKINVPKTRGKPVEENRIDKTKRNPSEKPFLKTKNQSSNNIAPMTNDMLNVKNKYSSKNKLKLNRSFHEIMESFEETPTSYIILDDSINCAEKIDTIRSSFGNKSQSTSAKKIDMDLEEKTFQYSESNENSKSENKSFVLLSENESNKSTSPDFNLGLLSSESNDSAELVNLGIEEQNLDTDNVIADNPLSKNNYLMVHSSGSPKVSLFIQQGKITAIDYDYCEDTKEIQSPIEQGNIFKLNRQSPYKNLLPERKPIFKTQPTVISKVKQISNNKTRNLSQSSQTPFTPSSETQI